MSNYTVQFADTLDDIAEMFGVSADDILRANSGLDPYNLNEGQVIFIPDGEEPPFSPPNHNSYGLAWGQKVSPDFRNKVVEICSALSIDPNHLMACMAFETGETFSPSTGNHRGSGATGLIQFMPKTAGHLGTSTAALAAMSAVEQLDYVEQYLSSYAGRLNTLEDVYMAILWPTAIGQSNDYVLFSQGSSAYSGNRLDFDKDGNVTKYEATSKVRTLLEKGLSMSA